MEFINHSHASFIRIESRSIFLKEESLHKNTQGFNKLKKGLSKLLWRLSSANFPFFDASKTSVVLLLSLILVMLFWAILRFNRDAVSKSKFSCNSILLLSKTEE